MIKEIYFPFNKINKKSARSAQMTHFWLGNANGRINFKSFQKKYSKLDDQDEFTTICQVFRFKNIEFLNFGNLKLEILEQNNENQTGESGDEAILIIDENVQIDHEEIVEDRNENNQNEAPVQGAECLATILERNHRRGSYNPRKITDENLDVIAATPTTYLSNEERDCRVCLQPLTNGEPVTSLLCKGYHTFHLICKYCLYFHGKKFWSIRSNSRKIWVSGWRKWKWGQRDRFFIRCFLCKTIPDSEGGLKKVAGNILNFDINNVNYLSDDIWNGLTLRYCTLNPVARSGLRWSEYVHMSEATQNAIQQVLDTLIDINGLNVDAPSVDEGQDFNCNPYRYPGGYRYTRHRWTWRELHDVARVEYGVDFALNMEVLLAIEAKAFFEINYEDEGCLLVRALMEEIDDVNQHDHDEFRAENLPGRHYLTSRNIITRICVIMDNLTGRPIPLEQLTGIKDAKKLASHFPKSLDRMDWNERIESSTYETWQRRALEVEEAERMRLAATLPIEQGGYPAANAVVVANANLEQVHEDAEAGMNIAEDTTESENDQDNSTNVDADGNYIQDNTGEVDENPAPAEAPAEALAPGGEEVPPEPAGGPTTPPMNIPGVQVFQDQNRIVFRVTRFYYEKKLFKINFSRIFNFFRRADVPVGLGQYANQSSENDSPGPAIRGAESLGATQERLQRSSSSSGLGSGTPTSGSSGASPRNRATVASRLYRISREDEFARGLQHRFLSAPLHDVVKQMLLDIYENQDLIMKRYILEQPERVSAAIALGIPMRSFIHLEAIFKIIFRTVEEGTFFTNALPEIYQQLDACPGLLKLILEDLIHDDERPVLPALPPGLNTDEYRNLFTCNYPIFGSRNNFRNHLRGFDGLIGVHDLDLDRRLLLQNDENTHPLVRLYRRKLASAFVFRDSSVVAVGNFSYSGFSETRYDDFNIFFDNFIQLADAVVGLPGFVNEEFRSLSDNWEDLREEISRPPLSNDELEQILGNISLPIRNNNSGSFLMQRDVRVFSSTPTNPGDGAAGMAAGGIGRSISIFWDSPASFGHNRRLPLRTIYLASDSETYRSLEDSFNSSSSDQRVVEPMDQTMSPQAGSIIMGTIREESHAEIINESNEFMANTDDDIANGNGDSNGSGMTDTNPDQD